MCKIPFWGGTIIHMLEILLEKYILKPVSFFIAFAIAIWNCLNLLPNENETYVKFILGCIFWCIILVFYAIAVFTFNKLPSASKKELGVLFVFHTESEEMFNDAKFNIIEKFNDVSCRFKIPLRPICLNVDKIRNYNHGNKSFMSSLLNNTNCMFCVDIIYSVDDVNNKENYEIKINMGALHPEFKEEDNTFLIGQLNRVAKPVKSRKFHKDLKFDTINVTVLHLHLVAKYIISLVFILSKNFMFSDVLLEDLYSVTKNQHNWFFELIKKAYFNSCTGIKHMYFDKFNLSNNFEDLTHAENYLNIMNDSYPKTYGYCLDMAYIQFLKYRNISEAKQLIDICKKIGITDTWMYSDAFLSAYSGENIVLVVKKYEKAIKSGYNIIDIIAFIESILIKEPDKFILHLVLSMLYKEIDDKKLSAIHLQSFIKSNSCKPENYLMKTIKKLQNDDCISCEFKSCEKCSKIAS